MSARLVLKYILINETDHPVSDLKKPLMIAGLKLEKKNLELGLCYKILSKIENGPSNFFLNWPTNIHLKLTTRF